MKKNIGLLLITCVMVLSASAQDDSTAFSCPLQQARLHIDSASMKMAGTAQDLKMILSSDTDSLVKATADAVVFAVQRQADGTYEIVYSHEDYYFWVSGIDKPLVRAQQRVSRRQAIGTLAPGKKLEILLFEFETPVDPADYLPCALPPAK